MDLAAILVAILSSFLYAYLSVSLPSKFAPIKLAYLLISIIFLMVSFFFLILTSYGYYSYQIPINVTDQNQTYSVNATVTKLIYSDQIRDISTTLLYGNFIILAITIVFAIILLLKEAFQPLQELAKKLEEGEK